MHGWPGTYQNERHPLPTGAYPAAKRPRAAVSTDGILLDRAWWSDV